MWVAASWWACTTEPSTTDSAPTDTPADHTGTPHTGAPPPEVTAAELAAAAQLALGWIPYLGLDACYDAYRTVSSNVDDACPPYTSASDPYRWETSEVCTTDAGTEWFGILTTAVDQDDYVQDELWNQMLFFGPTLSDDFVATPWFTGTAKGLLLDGSVWLVTGPTGSPPGTSFSLGGQFRSVRVRSNGVELVHHLLEGYCHGGVPAPGTWVAEPIDAWLHLTQLSATGKDKYHTVVDGSLSGLPAPWGTVDFADVTWDHPSLGGCAAEPDGELTIRRDDGVAVTVAFDQRSCDGCGQVVATAGGAVVTGGRVCLDASPLGTALQWEDLTP